jgi:hypothetical protein
VPFLRARQFRRGAEFGVQTSGWMTAFMMEGLYSAAGEIDEGLFLRFPMCPIASLMLESVSNMHARVSIGHACSRLHWLAVLFAAVLADGIFLSHFVWPWTAFVLLNVAVDGICSSLNVIFGSSPAARGMLREGFVKSYAQFNSGPACKPTGLLPLAMAAAAVELCHDTLTSTGR